MEDGNLSCVFQGSLDTAACVNIHQEMDQLLADLEAKDGVQITFDLGEVDYVASSFLRLCGKAAQRVGADQFSVVNIRPNIRKVFKIAGLESCLSLH
jgi:anti-anti-sigma factor